MGSWASVHIQKLCNGETVKIRPHGNSMKGRVESGQLCTLVPADPWAVKAGDVVLCRVNGHVYLHLVQAVSGSIEKGTRRYKIGNNKGHTNGWTTSVYGLLVAVED